MVGTEGEEKIENEDVKEGKEHESRLEKGQCAFPQDILHIPLFST
jgi:hypothetical protein